MPRAGILKKQTPSFGESLKSFRQARGLTQAALGKAINYSQRTISDIENEKVEPSQDFRDAIAQFKLSR